MRRTMVNLEFVKERRGHGGPYEVTQLINSFMGAMVHPWEQMDDIAGLDLKSITLREARIRRWPVLRHELPTDKIPKFYGDMLKWTRHSFAHGNIQFLNDGVDIVQVRFWNQDRQDKRTWGTVVSVTMLEEFLWFFQDLAEGRVPRSREERLSESAD